jgi:hypothetical protein
MSGLCIIFVDFLLFAPDAMPMILIRLSQILVTYFNSSLANSSDLLLLNLSKRRFLRIGMSKKGKVNIMSGLASARNMMPMQERVPSSKIGIINAWILDGGRK